MTRRSSVRARARQIYRELAAGAAASSNTATPTPDPSPLKGGGEKKDLTARVRALYEGSAVPVAQIGQLAGVTERTIYKYVAKGGWAKRHRAMPRGEAAAASNRGQRFQNAPGFAPVRGAGGRFIRREDTTKPVAQGLKATDPVGRTRAEAACLKAEGLARVAQAQAEAYKRYEAQLHALDWTSRACADLRRFRNDRAKDRIRKRRPSPLQDRIEGILICLVEIAVRRLETILARHEAG